MDMSGDLHHDIRLEEAQQMSIAHDIRIFYEYEFSEIKKKSWRQYDELPVEWPGEHSIRSLVEQAIPLSFSPSPFHATLRKLILGNAWI